MTPTPDDPGAIDLEEVKGCCSDIPKLKAAVVALRDEVAGYHTLFDLAEGRERLWLEKWRIASGRPDSLPDYGEMLTWMFGQIEAAEARDKENAETYLQEIEHFIERAEAAEARAKAVEDVVKASDSVIDTGQRLRSDPGSHELALAALCDVMGQLAKFDALDKEGP